jgi:hypothetical protein
MHNNLVVGSVVLKPFFIIPDLQLLAKCSEVTVRLVDILIAAIIERGPMLCSSWINFSMIFRCNNV